MPSTDQTTLIDSLRGGLIVSCQAYPGEPMRTPDTMARVALAAEAGGAVALRCQGLADISAIRGQVSVPVIGLWKVGDSGVVITPTLRHARACHSAGADIVALDATGRTRPDGRSFTEIAKAMHDQGAVVMADCGSLADADQAVEAGVALLSTTLAGYSGDRPHTSGPDLELLSEICAAHPGVPVVAEGRVRSPQEAAAALDAGAWSVAVGTAITHPTSITAGFRQALVSRS
ncbi:N-acetylmannosamine-6-phosphate 2-epimerase [Nesterenkonia haasae]|uniref:N-acetylmannosamine-6-phosphate 2-epimerase n=1 Tax=Nesterenkonia haasae TaxID=2587813 RepID=UPI001391CAE6|nr:N-acetylmannosamine-6-phosphate 2-epimerase [Nesterenkonia haasae]NDK31683.1 N-acetylmannosamine-6-phosphate 2-epimerase [Nesterenkonia haasae]